MSELSLQSIEKLKSRINDEITTNGASEITGIKLNKVLNQLARSGNQQRIPCDAGLVEGDIGKVIGLDPSDGLAKVYTESAPVAGVKAKYELNFTNFSSKPQGRKAVMTGLNSLMLTSLPTVGETLSYDDPEIGIVFTFVAGVPANNREISVGATVYNAAENIATALNLMTNPYRVRFYASLASVTGVAQSVGTFMNGMILTFSDTGFLDFTADHTGKFEDGAAAITGDYQLRLKAGATTKDLLSSDWCSYTEENSINDYTTGTQEATGFRAYIAAHPEYGFTATRSGSVVTLEQTDVTQDNEQDGAIIINELPTVTLTLINESQRYFPKSATWLYLGVLQGLEVVSAVNYAVVKKGGIQRLTLKANNPLDIAGLEPANYGTDIYRALIICAADGGQVKSVSGVGDAGGLIGMAISGADDEPTTQPILVVDDAALAAFSLAEVFGNDPVEPTSKGYIEYVARLTQVGTAAPTASIIKNELSADIVWTRTGAGVYLGTLADAFTVGKTAVLITNQYTVSSGLFSAYFAECNSNAGVISLYCTDGTTAGTGMDDGLENTLIEIRVYN